MSGFCQKCKNRQAAFTMAQAEHRSAVRRYIRTERRRDMLAVERAVARLEIDKRFKEEHEAECQVIQ